MDHTRLTYRNNSRGERLIDVAGKAIQKAGVNRLCGE